jgi:hypothetical protein
MFLEKNFFHQINTNQSALDKLIIIIIKVLFALDRG